MNRVDTTQTAVVLSMVDVLIQSVPGLTPKTCFLSVYPDPPSLVPEPLFCTVSIWTGTFPPEFQDGGGQLQCTEDVGVLVKCFSRMKTDKVGHDAHALTDEARGLLTLKGQLLRALVGQDLVYERNLILRDLVRAKSATAPEKSSAFEGYVEFSLLFSCLFDWDLTS